MLICNYFVFCVTVTSLKVRHCRPTCTLQNGTALNFSKARNDKNISFLYKCQKESIVIVKEICTDQPFNLKKKCFVRVTIL